MRKLICFIGLVVVSCSVPDLITLDKSEYSEAYTLFNSATNPEQFRTAASAFTKFISDYPASGYVDDAWYYLGRSYSEAAELDEAQLNQDSTKTIAEYRKSISAFESVEERSTRNLSAVYYRGYDYYQIWNIVSTDLSSRSNALKLLGQVPSSAPYHYFAPASRYYTGHIYRKSDSAKNDSALYWYDKCALDTLPRGSSKEPNSYSVNSLYWGGCVSQAMGDLNKSRARYEAYLRFEPDSGAYTADANKRLALLSPEFVAYTEARALFEADNFTLAISKFESFINSYPSSSLIQDARYYLGRSYKGLGETSSYSRNERVRNLVKAIDLFKNITATSRLEWSRYYSGSSSYDIGQLDTLPEYYDRAISYYRQVVDANSSFSSASTCFKEIAFSYRLRPTANLDSAVIWFDRLGQDETGIYWGAISLQDAKKNSEAVSRYDSYRNSFKSGKYFASSLYGSAYCIYLQGDTDASAYSKAIETFTSFVTTYGTSDSTDNARLYGGHCYRKMGDRSKAAEWFEAGVNAGDGSKKGDCVYWAGVQFDILNNSSKMDDYLEQYITGYELKTASFDDASYYADAKKRLGN